MLREAESTKGNGAIPNSQVRSEVRGQPQRTEVAVQWRTWERIQKGALDLVVIYVTEERLHR